MTCRIRLAAVALSLIGCSGASGIQTEDVHFGVTQTTSVGQSVWVVGDIPALGNNNAAYGVRLEPSAYPLWQAAVAIPKGTTFAYQFAIRNDNVAQWSNPANSSLIGSPTSSSTTAGDPQPSRKGLYYHSGWASPRLNWRTGPGAYTMTFMTPFGPGRTPAETRWRALGLGQAEQAIEFYFTDGGAGRDPAVGSYSTTLDAFFVQDGHLFDYSPPASVGPPQQINFPVFFSTILNENRPYRVLVPRGYAANVDKHYPVLYLHDGQNVFDFGPFGTWYADEQTEYLIRNGQLREIIIVAIDNTVNRALNYIPPDDIVPIGPGAGGPGQADQYAAFIIDELKPVIDANYRTYPDRDNTGTLGSSLGGVVSLYLGWDFNDVFARCGPMSGAWQLPNFPARVLSEPYHELRIYLDSGDSGPANDNAVLTMNLRSGLMAKGYVLLRDLKHVVGYGHLHNEAAWAARLPGALTYLFPVTEAENPLRIDIFRGDLDHDADMDLDDHALLVACLAGPGVPAAGPCIDPAAADLDDDGDSDLRDAAIAAKFFAGTIP